MLFALPDTRSTWWVYTVLLAAVALFFFADLARLPLDTHDEDYFLDSADALADPAAFFAADKRMPGRPALELVFLLQYLAWDTSVAAYHLCGGLFHLIAALSLARASRALGLDIAEALLTGLLFLINVSHFNAIHWISAQCYALVLICGCSSLCAHLRAHRASVYALLLTGTLFHISAAAFLPFILYLCWRRNEREAIRGYLPLALLLTAVVLGLKIGYPQAPQATIVAAGFEPWGLLRNQLVCWSRLFSTAHWLAQPLYEFPVWEWAVGAMGLFAFAVLQWRYHAPLSLWLAWIFAHLLPILVLSPTYIETIPSGPSRYLYLASAGVAGLLSCALCRLALLSTMPRLVLILLVLLVSYSSYAGLNRTTAIAHYASGRHFLASHQLDQGIAQLKRAIAIAPETIDLEDTYVRLIPMLYNRSDAQADQTLANALARFPQNHTLRLCRLALDSLAPSANANTARRKLDSFKKSQGVSRLIGELYYNIGRGRQKQGERSGALNAFRRSLEFDPQRPQSKKGFSETLAMPERP